jgi:hypothetical protein
MHRIEQVGFTHTIFAANTDYPFLKIERLVGIILKLDQRYGLQKKHEVAR